MEYLVVLFILSLAIILLALLMFRYLWLNKHTYIMPASICDSESRTDIRLFPFLWKMSKYIYWTDIYILSDEIGFEQAHYLYFYRIALVLTFSAGIFTVAVVIAWVRLKTDNLGVFVGRLVSAKDLNLTDSDFHTFMQSIYTIVVTLLVIHYRSNIAKRNSRYMDKAERKAKTGQSKEKVWFQVRTMKISGLTRSDEKGQAIKLIFSQIMKLHNIHGAVEHVSVVPDLKPAIICESKLLSLKQK
jgi:hypothetical protein